MSFGFFSVKRLSAAKVFKAVRVLPYSTIGRQRDSGSEGVGAEKRLHKRFVSKCEDHRVIVIKKTAEKSGQTK